LVEKKMSESLKNNKLTSILIAGILFTSLTSTSLVNAQSIPTTLTIAVSYPPPFPPNTECTMEATLKDENGNPLQNMDIDFYVCGTNCMDRIGTVKTDSTGVASLKYNFPGAGTYNVTAIFSGTTNYAQSSSENVDIIIIDYSPYLIGGGLIAVAIIGIVGYIVFRRRKKAITMLMTAKEA
jgi:multisubunit Na+/H+ antiporter MnhB subunit